ncbi:hypothetical protein CRYUN_Cryun03dG0153700 [Craigia yunnanensis]
MNNLYESVENLEMTHLRTEACKTMLLYPRNGAEDLCKKLRLKIDDSKPLEHFICGKNDCSISGYKLLSHYQTAICNCGTLMNSQKFFQKKVSTSMTLDARDRGVFVKGPNRLIVSDELRVMPSSTAASFTFFSKLGIIDTSSIEEKTFSVGVDKALNLLNCSLVSKQPLTEALLEQKVQNPVSKLSKEDLEQVSFAKPRLETTSNQVGKIKVKLMISKSKNRVCYGEASEDFVDLLFSFLTVPLGFIVKEMQGGTSKGSIYHLYDSIQDLDTWQYLKTKENAGMLVSPKLAPGFGYEGQPLDIKEYIQPPYHYYIDRWSYRYLTSDETLLSSGDIRNSAVLTVKDPKSQLEDSASGRGFVIGPAMFTITDDLIIAPLSSVAGLSSVRKLKIPFSDIEECLVYVGKEEALRLLLASYYSSEAALTNALLLKQQKQEVEFKFR